MRAAITIVVATVVFCVGAPLAWAHTPAGRIVVITVDGTDLSDWRRANVPEINSLLADGGTALLSTGVADRARPTQQDCEARGQRALRTMLEGRAAPGGEFEERNTALSLAVTAHNLFLGIARATLADASFPGGHRVDHAIFRRAMTRSPQIAIFPVIDTLVADCRTGGESRSGWVTLSLRRAGQLVTAARAAADYVIMASLVPPRERAHAGNTLTAIAVTGMTSPGRALRSATTRRDGVVATEDIAATVLRIYRLRERAGDGARMTEAGTQSLDRLASRYAHAAGRRHGFVAALAAIATLLMATGFLVVASGRGRTSGGTRQTLSFLLCAVAALPAATLIESAVRVEGEIAGPVTIFGMAVGLAVIAFGAGGGARRAWIVVAGATLVIATADAVLQGALSSAGVLSSGVAAGTRFGGFDDATLGALIAGVLVWAGGALDASPRLVQSVGAIVVVVFLLAVAPFGGDRLAYPLLAVPSFLVLTVRTRSLGLNRTGSMGLAIATLLIAGVAAALRAPNGSGSIPQGPSWWAFPVAAAAVVAGVLAARRPALLSRAMWGKPSMRVALSLCAATAGVGLGTQPDGIAFAGSMTLVAGTALMGTLLAGESYGSTVSPSRAATTSKPPPSASSRARAS